MAKRVAVVLSGCGYLDGAEIHESVLTLLALDGHKLEYHCFAPDIPQMHVVNHSDGQPEDATPRNVFVESARIARGNISKLNTLVVNDYDAIVFPGGYGVAKNLCNFATEGENMKINPDVERIAKSFAEVKKPAGYLCIAPVILGKIYGQHVQCTIGNDKNVAEVINSTGGQHKNCTVDDIIVDENLRVVTTPAYMLAKRISEAALGIEKLVHQISIWLEQNN